MGRRTVTTTGFEAFLCYLTFASVRRVVTTTKQQIKNIISGDGATVCLFMPRHVTLIYKKQQMIRSVMMNYHIL